MSDDVEKLILSQDTYNTLTKSSNKKTVSFYNARNSMKRKMSSCETQCESSLSNILLTIHVEKHVYLPAGLVYSSPQFVGSIQVVDRRGQLVRLEQREEAPHTRLTQGGDENQEDHNGQEDQEDHNGQEGQEDQEDNEAYHVMTNSKYVANIAFNKQADMDRKTR